MDFEYKIQGNVIFNNKLFCKTELENIVQRTKKYILTHCNTEMIAIAMPRSVFLLTSILTLLDCRIAYILIDVDLMPKERIDYILKDSGVHIVLTVSNFKYNFLGKQVIKVDEIEDSRCCVSDYRVSNALAYLLYTSGTTGHPKGVEISRKSLSNFIEGITHIIQFNRSEKIVSFTSPSFDIFFLEAIMPLYFGMTVVLGSKQEINNPQNQIQLIKSHKVNMIQITPSALRLLSKVDTELTFLSYVHTIMVGGEVFPQEILGKLQLYPNLKIYNMYGPTETTIWSSVADLTTSDCVHLGAPICNTEIMLLNQDLCVVDDEIEGEICISGLGLAERYHNNEKLTKEKFCALQQPFNKTVYRTGDIGVVDGNGKLLYVGRNDNQIKFHGHRIELEEIEATILSTEKVSIVVVCFDKESDQLIAFYSSKCRNLEETFFQDMKAKLPRYMIPSKFIFVKEFIYTSNGKIDRDAVLNQYLKNLEIDYNETEERNSVLNLISFAASKCLNVSKNLVFFDLSIEQLGFDSITYVEFIVELEALLELDFDENILSIDNFENLNQLYDYILSLNDVRGV